MKAAMTARSHVAVLELLIALLVFFVGDVIVGMLQIPATVVYLLSNKEYMSMIMSYSVDFEKIMNLMMNMPDWIIIINLLLEVALIAVFILYCRLFEKRKAETMGFRRKGFVIEYLKGIASAFILFIIAYGICVVTGSMVFHSVSVKGTTALYVIGFLFGYLVQGMAEEVICRGYLLVSLSRRYSVSVSIILSAAFFSMLHGMNAGVGILAFVNLFLFGEFLGLLFVRCENIWVVGAVHSIWNFLQGNIFGIQVSGMRLQPSLFTTDMTKGGEIINGGSFGIEGGLAVTLMLLLATALLLMNMSKNGYFVKMEPIVNPYDRYPNQNYTEQAYPNYEGQNMFRQNENVPNGNVQDLNAYYPNENVAPEPSSMPNSYENMGLNPKETPWHPQGEKQDEKKITGFDKNYFKE